MNKMSLNAQNTFIQTQFLALLSFIYFMPSNDIQLMSQGLSQHVLQII